MLLDIVTARLNITTTEYNEVLQSIIAQATSYFENITGILTSQQTKHYYNENIASKYYLPFRPIISVTTDQDYTIIDNWVIFTELQSGVDFDYTVGYDTLPADIEAVIANLAIFFYSLDASSTFHKDVTPSAIPEYLMEQIYSYK